MRALDDALLRHGRFDYVIPIGLPDEDARGSIWSRYVPDGTPGLDLGAVVTASRGFSPADIEHAARTASQRAFERALNAGPGADPDNPARPVTEDYLDAVRATRATVSAEQAQQFAEDIDAIARL